MISLKKSKYYKWALFLEYATIISNLFEGFASIFLGLLTGSVSLFAYGLESGIEVFASSVVIWELKGSSKKRKKIALRLIGSAYLVASIYIFTDAVKNLIEGHHPERSILGIFLLAFTATVMVILGIGKRIIGKILKSEPVMADAKFTLIDAALSITILVGLVFIALFDWWWMDQIIAIFLSGVAFREGLRELL